MTPVGTLLYWRKWNEEDGGTNGDFFLLGFIFDWFLKSDSGFLADNIQAWQNSLIQLLENPEERQKFGKLGRKAVENFYSSKVQAPLIRDILHNAVKFKS